MRRFGDPSTSRSRSVLTFSWRYPALSSTRLGGRRVEDVVDPESGLKACFISREDLIAAKLASGRPQDLADVDAIRKAAESQEDGYGQ